MKLLKLCVPNGYKMLEPGFEINFLTKTRVDKEMPNDDLLELQPNFYYPIETVFVGKNSSGKTTVLSLINLALSFISNGRIPNEETKDGKPFILSLTIYHEGCLYQYEGSFVRGTSVDDEYLRIQSESLSFATLRTYHRKDLSNVSYRPLKGFAANAGADTSSLPRYCGTFSTFYLPSGRLFYVRGYRFLWNLFRKIYSEDVMEKIIRLFDDSIEYIKPWTKGEGTSSGYVFKRIHEEPLVVDESFLESHLSEGTTRGILLYGISALLFEEGGYLVIDEIERSFHKNLVENLFLMFNDRNINRAGACLIYSTHYSELLDCNARNDNINVLHRDEKTITLANVAKDYDVRSDLRRSAQFDENAFESLLNYEALMDLKDALRKR